MVIRLRDREKINLTTEENQPKYSAFSFLQEQRTMPVEQTGMD